MTAEQPEQQSTDQPYQEPVPAETPQPDFETLQQALQHFDCPVEPAQVEPLDRYRQQLWKWNESLNLTRHTTLEKFVTRDVVDSLELSKWIDRGQRVLDVGTGGGVPGLILAICRADLRISVCESTQKKARAVQAIVEQLKLPVQVHACRAEELLQLQTFDTLVARAVAPIPKLLYWLDLHWDAFDQLLLIKGRAWTKERADARHRGLLKKLEVRKQATYLTPATQAESVILKLWRKGLTPEED